MASTVGLKKRHPTEPWLMRTGSSQAPYEFAHPTGRRGERSDLLSAVERQELARLRRENAELRIEREILKVHHPPGRLRPEEAAQQAPGRQGRHRTVLPHPARCPAHHHRPAGRYATRSSRPILAGVRVPRLGRKTQDLVARRTALRNPPDRNERPVQRLGHRRLARRPRNDNILSIRVLSCV